LFVSYFFPPYNSIGAVRVGKTVQYLTEFGYDVRVITAKDQPVPRTLQIDIPHVRVSYTGWFDVNKPAELAVGGRRNVAMGRYTRWGALPGAGMKMGVLYKSLVNVPDGKVGWIPFAISAAARCIKSGWKPDIIYASGMPFSALVSAHLISTRYGIPWVGELRDLFADDHYYPYPKWRRRIDDWMERRTLSSASALVTVSEPLAETLQMKYGKPTAIVLNGFASEDYPPAVFTGGRKTHAPFLSVVYTGILTGLMYELKRDPSPLFEALHRLGDCARKVRVIFYGRDSDAVRGLAERAGVADLVESHAPITHRDALKVQSEADVLLLLVWNSPESRGTYTGKLFEYLGARRPILAICPDDNVAARLIRSRGAGVVLTDPQAIADQLARWLREKEKNGMIPFLSSDVAHGLSRREQTRHLERFLRGLMVEA
jgi:hypothetical protein